MNIVECPIDLEEVMDSRATGSVIISDVTRTLIRPAVPGQYPASVKHDSRHAYRLLDMANDRGGDFQGHIICQEDPATVHRLLDGIFYAYVDMSCFEQWCDARVVYIVDGKTVEVKEYGSTEHSHYTMVFSVYCGIPADQTEEFIARLSAEQTDHYVVIRPDSSGSGLDVRSFAFEYPELDGDDGYPEDEALLD